MKSSGIFWGVTLVAIGVLFVLRNLGVFSFNWFSFLDLWPLLLLILGISLLPINGYIRIILAFLVVVGAVVYLNTHPETEHDRFWDRRWFRNWDRWDDSDANTNDWNEQILSQDYDSTIRNAVLDLDAVAGEFTMNTEDRYLIKFDREGTLGNYDLLVEDAGTSKLLKLTLEGRNIKAKNLTNKADIGLNPAVTWDIKMNAGAADIDFDLSQLKVDQFDIDGGASSIKLKLGDKFEKTDLRIEAGAASIDIEVPESVGCEVRTSTVLSSKTLDDFEKTENGVYQTAGFESSPKQILIKIEAAVSSLTVERY